VGNTDVPTEAVDDGDSVSFSVLVLRNLFRRRLRTLLTVLGIDIRAPAGFGRRPSTLTGQGNGVGWKPVAHGVNAATANRPGCDTEV